MVFINEEEPKRFSIVDNVIVGHPKPEEPHGISKLVLDSLTKYPDFVAQINANTGENTTFAQIKDRSVRCALWLKKQGIGKNDVVCVSTPLQTDDLVPCLATLFVGAVLNPWYHILTPVVTRRFFDMMEPKVVFADQGSIELLSQVAREKNLDCKFVVFGNHADYPSLHQIMSQQTKDEVDNFVHVEPEDPKSQIGAIFFSSGTTGNQKGTMLSYDTLLKNRMDCLPIRQGMTAMWYSNMSWITGVNMTTLCHRMRVTRIIHDEFDAEETSKVLERYKVNFAFFTPTMLTSMSKSKVFTRYDFSALERIIIGGSKPSKAILKETREALPHCHVLNSYGMTELGGAITVQRKTTTDIGSIGYIVEGVKMKVIDPKTGRSLGPNQEGELCFTLGNMMLGYWKNPEETAKMFDDEGWLHTGDLGYYDACGEIMITDRNKEVIICRNHHISPSEIENILVKHPGVVDAAVVPVPNSVDVERPIAFVVKSPTVEVTAEELRDLPASVNEYFRLTGGVVFVEKLPYTSTGKKSFKELKEMARAYAK